MPWRQPQFEADVACPNRLLSTAKYMPFKNVTHESVQAVY